MILPNFQRCKCKTKVNLIYSRHALSLALSISENCLENNKHRSLHLARKICTRWIFVLGHYLFLKVHSFSRATLSENCSLLGTDNVSGQISVQMEAVAYITIFSLVTLVTWKRDICGPSLHSWFPNVRSLWRAVLEIRGFKPILFHERQV